MIDYKKKINSSAIKEEFNIISEKIEGLKLPKGFSQFVRYALSELSANIEEHSKATNVFIDINIDKNCSIKLIDNGVGLRESYLSKKICPKDDSVAIEFALGGLSTKNLQERGFGLYSIRKLVVALKGEIIIESGSAQAMIKENQINFKKPPREIQGLAITIKTGIKNLDFYSAIE